MLITPQQQMVFFTFISFIALGFGSLVLSLVTLVGRGSRAFAFIMAISTIALGLFMYFQLDHSGWMPTALGGLAFIVACWPPRKRKRYTEDEELDRQGF